VKLAADQKARDWDLLDFVDMMPATGKRIVKNSAITWDALDLDAGTVEIRGTVIRVKGKGLRIKPKPKSRAGYRKLRLPLWAVDMLRCRKRRAVPNEWGVVFTSPHGPAAGPEQHPSRPPRRVPADRLPLGDLTRVPQDSRHAP
jgi:integrase